MLFICAVLFKSLMNRIIISNVIRITNNKNTISYRYDIRPIIYGFNIHLYSFSAEKHGHDLTHSCGSITPSPSKSGLKSL